MTRSESSQHHELARLLEGLPTNQIELPLSAIRVFVRGPPFLTHPTDTTSLLMIRRVEKWWRPKGDGRYLQSVRDEPRFAKVWLKRRMQAAQGLP